MRGGRIEGEREKGEKERQLAQIRDEMRKRAKEKIPFP